MANFWELSPNGTTVRPPRGTGNGAVGWILRPAGVGDPVVDGTCVGTVDVDLLPYDTWVVRGVNPIRTCCVSTHSVLQDSRLVFWVSPNGNGDDTNVRVYWWVRGCADSTRSPLLSVDRSAWRLRVVLLDETRVGCEEVRLLPGGATQVMSACMGRGVWAGAVGAGWVAGGGVPQDWDRDTVGSSGVQF